MLLCEEYVKRHTILVPLVKHASQAAIFYKDHGSWQIKAFKWHPPDVHPGIYSVNILRPTHNGIEKGRCFEHVTDETHLQWDEYESYLLDWMREPRELPKTEHEVTVAAWEMLLRCCDRVLIRHVHNVALSRSIDLDIPVETRCELIHQCLAGFARSHGDVYRVWEGDLKYYREHHATWLSEMVTVCSSAK